jgi:hypothetical protein
MIFTGFDITPWVLLLILSICIDTESQYSSKIRKDWCRDIKCRAEEIIHKKSTNKMPAEAKKKLFKER